MIIISIYVSSTQFLTYTAKVSTSAKINEVKKIKHAPSYRPSIDYWKQLRDEIKRLHENKSSFEELPNLISKVPEAKQKNYSRAISKYSAFLNSNDVEYFTPGKSYWKLSNELFVRTSPELGLIVNGKKLYVKNWYKKADNNTKITKRNINYSLTMMQLSDRDFKINDNENFAVLNLQTGKIIEASPLVSEAILELKVESDNFVNIWIKI